MKAFAGFSDSISALIDDKKYRSYTDYSTFNNLNKNLLTGIYFEDSVSNDK